MKRLLFILCSIASTAYSSDAKRPHTTDRKVVFAGDPQPHLYTKEITDRLAMVQAAQKSGFFTESDPIDFSRTPDLTKEAFDELVFCMNHSEYIPSNQDLLDTLTHADRLLIEDDPTRKNLLNSLMRRVKLQNDTVAENQDPQISKRQQFFNLFTNHQATLFAEELRKRIKAEDCSYHEALQDYSTKKPSEHHVNGIWTVPVPHAADKKPRLEPLPFSLEDLKGTQKMRNVDTVQNRDTRQPETILLLTELCLTSVAGLPHFAALDTLNLRGNYIRHLPDNAFTATPNLKNLLLARNLIETIDPQAFSGLSLLEKLELTANLLTTLDLRAFAKLPQLQGVNCESNTITSITLEDGTKKETIPGRIWAWRTSPLRCCINLKNNPIPDCDTDED